jgi:DNA repair protein RecO (recombination protein O)
MNQSCEALTLRTYPFGESNLIALFLTRGAGQLRGVAYGAKKTSSRFGSSLEPLTHVRVTFKQRENRELAVIENCEIIRPLPAFELSWEQSLYLSYFAELLIEFAREQVESEKLFRLSLAVLGAVQKVSLPALARYMELWILRLEGVLPALDRLMPHELAEKTARILGVHPDQLAEASWDEDEINRLESVTEKLLEYHLEKPLKARRMLKELL